LIIVTHGIYFYARGVTESDMSMMNHYYHQYLDTELGARRPSQCNVARCLKTAGLCILLVFAMTAVTLHGTLEMLDDEDLLSNTNDWRQNIGNKIAIPNKLQIVDKATNVKATKPQSRTQRSVFEERYPPHDMGRVKASVKRLHKPRPATHTLSNMTYDIYNCPMSPPAGYPVEWPLVANLLNDWNVDTTEVPDKIYQGLCVFDWDKPGDMGKVEAYRQAEQPFVLINHPEVLRTTERWNHNLPGEEYIRDMVGPDRQQVDYSKGNHQMYANVNPFNILPEGWEPQTVAKRMTYDEWLKKAKHLETVSDSEQAGMEHWYFRLKASLSRKINEYLYDELPIFRPETSVFMPEPSEERGINCRFGVKGTIAELHFDYTRNWVLLLGGQRRYILSHPRQCKNMEMYLQGHPSARHSSVNWSDPPTDPDRPFTMATANEVVMQPGEALYMPTSWLHFIISLDINYQCNARSGITTENNPHLRECGFQVRDTVEK